MACQYCLVLNTRLVSLDPCNSSGLIALVTNYNFGHILSFFFFSFELSIVSWLSKGCTFCMPKDVCHCLEYCLYNTNLKHSVLFERLTSSGLYSFTNNSYLCCVCFFTSSYSAVYCSQKVFFGGSCQCDVILWTRSSSYRNVTQHVSI